MDVRAHHITDDSGEQRIMGTTQDKGIDTGLPQREEVFTGDGFDDGITWLEPALLHQRDEEWAGEGAHSKVRVNLGEGAFISAAFNGGSGSDESDITGVRELRGPFHGGLYDADNRQWAIQLEVLQAVSTDGSAGDDDGFKVEMGEEAQILACILEEGISAAVAVRDASGIAEVDDRFGGQEPSELPHGGQAAQTGIEDADRLKVHSRSSLL